MDNSIEETLKKFDEWLTRQTNEKEKILQEIRNELVKLNESSGKDEAGAYVEVEETEQVISEENQQDIKADYENIDAESESESAQESESGSESNEPILIAVVGAKSRMGTTHCAVSIANYLVRQSNRTAVMEFNGSGEFAAMGRYFLQAQEEEFVYQDVKYYSRCTLQLLDYVAATGKFDFLILDLGNYSVEKTLFLRSDVRFIVSSGKPWELENLFLVFREINKNILIQSNFVFNFVPENGKEAILSGMSELGQVYFSSYIENPFEEIDESIEGLLKEYIKIEEDSEGTVNKEKSKLLSIFRRNKHEKNEERGKRKDNLVQAVSAE